MSPEKSKDRIIKQSLARWMLLDILKICFKKYVHLCPILLQLKNKPVEINSEAGSFWKHHCSYRTNIWNNYYLQKVLERLALERYHYINDLWRASELMIKLPNCLLGGKQQLCWDISVPGSEKHISGAVHLHKLSSCRNTGNTVGFISMQYLLKSCKNIVFA